MKLPEAAWEVNEANWHLCQDVGHLMGFLHDYAPVRQDYSDPKHLRRLRLLVAAALRQVWGQLTDSRSRAAILASEQYADDRNPTPLAVALSAAQLAHDRLEGEWVALRDTWLATGSDPNFQPLASLAGIAQQAAFAAWDAAAPDDSLTDWENSACWSGVLDTLLNVVDPAMADSTARQMARDGHLRLFRDIFGNPFRPVTFDPSWRTSTVVALAEQMYESRDFSPMPVLADALQDAGCEHEAILAHCRADAPHVRGCWVVDLVLGKQ